MPTKQTKTCERRMINVSFIIPPNQKQLMVYGQKHGLTNCDIVTECITIQQ